VLPVSLGVLQHGGTGVGNKGLPHGSANPQAQELVRLGLVLAFGQRHNWDRKQTAQLHLFFIVISACKTKT